MADKPTCDELEQRIRELEQAESELEQAKAALHESEELYRKLIEFLPLPVVVTQEETLVFANPAAARLFGTRRQDEIIGSSPKDWTHPAFAEHAYQRRREAIETGKALDPVELVIVRKDKEEAIVLANATFISHQGSPALLSVFQDITERKEAETALQQAEQVIRESEMKYRGFVEHTTEGVYCLELESPLDIRLPVEEQIDALYESARMIECNQAFADMYGLSREKLAGMRLIDFHGDRNDPVNREEIRRFVVNGYKVKSEDTQEQDAAGKIHWFSNTTIGIVENHCLKWMWGTQTDITQRKLSEKALIESEKKWKNILVRTPQIGISLDPQARITFANQHFLKMAGWDEHEVIGQDWFSLFIPEHVRDEVRGVFNTVMRQKATLGFSSYENEIVTKTGELRNVAWSNVLTKDSQENISDVTSLGIDLTEIRRTEEKLRKREAELRLHSMVLDQIQDHVTITDMNGLISYVNEAHIRNFGRSKESLFGQSTEIYGEDPERGATQREILERTLSEGFWRGEVVNYSADGAERIMNCRTQIVYDDQEAPVALCGVSSDVTDYKRSEEMQKKLRAQLTNALEMAQLGHWEYDVAKDLFTFNDQFYKIFHTTVEELGKYTLSSAEYAHRFVHPDDRHMVAEEIQKAIEAAENTFSRQLEHRMLYTDGTVGFIAVRFLVVKDAKGKTIRTYGVNQDVTERKKTERNLWESKERFEKVFDSQLDAIFVLNAEVPARVLECNRACTKIFGYDPDEMIGETIKKLHVDDIYQKAFQDKLYAQMKQEGHLTDFEFSMKRKNGTVFPTEHSVFELKNDAGERTGWVSMVRDLTERKLMESRLRQAQKMESIGNLAGGIAHDFNNILSPIMIHAEMALMDLPKDSPVQHSLKQIYKAGERAKDLVKQILTFARKREGTRAHIRVSSIIKETIKFLRSTIPTTIEIQSHIRASQDMVLGDPTELNQIIMNLCTNAAHAMETRGGVIEVVLENEQVCADSPTRIQTLNPGPYLKLTVKDTGCGIDPQILDKVFEPYFTTKDTGKGTGMGLAIVHGIVKSYAGAITVRSVIGRGTAFYVYLPLVEEHIDVPGTPVGSEQLLRGNERILLIDDEDAAVAATRMILERLGYTVTSRTSSVEALEAFLDNPEGFDLVITDMTMPNMTGKELAMESMTIRPDIPVILCTGFSEQMNEKMAKEMGIRAFVMKPIVMSQIADTIRKVLDNRYVNF